MARVARKNIETKYTHVMVQGIGKEYVFADDECKGYYLTSIQKAQEKIQGKVLAFCIMGNHAHLLLYMEKAEELGKFMQKTNSEYAKYYNRTRKRVGYVFRDRYRSEGITNTKYLLNCVIYIQNNPVKAGIVKKAEEYKYSSYINYLSGRGMVDFEEAGKHYDTSAKNIKEMMMELCENNWMDHDDKEYEEPETVFEEIMKKYNITSKSSVRNEELAKKIAIELHERCGISYREIATILEIGRETLRKWLSTPPSP